MYLTTEYLKLLESDPDQSTMDPIILSRNDLVERISKLKSDHRGITYDDWSKGLIDKYIKIRSLSEKYFPGSWYSIEFILSVQKILNIDGCSLPFAGIILGPPGTNKTLVTDMLTPWPNVYYTRNFTAKSFVSHNSSIPKENLADIDMLPKVRFKTLVTPELTPLFSASDDALRENIGVITSILDGKGHKSNTGAQGQRGYDGNYMFSWIGAAVNIPDRVFKLLAYTGPKLYFYRLPYMEINEQAILDGLNENFDDKRKSVEGALLNYLVWFEICPSLVEDEESHLMKMKFDHTLDHEPAKKYLYNLATLLSKLRGYVDINSPKQHEYNEYPYSLAQTEHPMRAAQQLYNLSKGHALSMGRNYIIMQDIEIPFRVALSTASIERVAVFDLLIESGGKARLSQIASSIKVSKSTALKVMTELQALELVDLEEVEVGGNTTKQLSLKPEFEWLISLQSEQLKDGFKPVDRSRYPSKLAITH